jgi:metallophosphoesterase (TIGR00282 family)
MKILYLGDIMASPGISVIETLLPKLKREHAIDVVIAQAENVTDGKGLSKADFKRLKQLGIDAFTGGNHSLAQEDIFDDLNDPQQAVTRPANYPEGTPGRQYKFVQTSKGKVLVVSLLGAIVGKDADKPTDNPLHTIDAILEETKDQATVATVVNFHGDFSSEKVIMGHYLDGRVSLVVGDHWHVPTADAMLLPQGTAYITDVGMCGILYSSLGVTFDSVIPRWRDGKVTPNQIETNGTLQLNGVIADIDEATGLARSITQVRQTIEQ